MTLTFTRSAVSILLLVTLSMTSGCVFTVVADPNAYPVVAADITVPAGTTVEIVNGFDAKYMARMEGNLQADLQQFTATAVTQLTRELGKKGIASAAGGKRIVLEVTGPTVTRAMGFVRCSVSLDAKVGETKISAWGEAAGMDAQRNFSAAISHAVEDLLKKPALGEYLSKP
jgi:hypothetical protein